MTFCFVVISLCTFGLNGCKSPTSQLPQVLGENPTLAQIQQANNQNSEKIQSLHSSDAYLSVANSPGWAKCQLVFQRPNRVRVIGTGNIVGRVLDCGCNDDTFWFWSKLQDPPQLAYCKISEFQNSSLHNIIPIDPTWFPEAFGVVELKTEEIIEGPTSQSDGTLLIVTKRTRPDGQYTKYTYIDPKTAAIKRQDILDPTNTPVISVVCNEFQLESTQNVVLPKKINIECPKTGESLSLDLGNLSINATDSITAQTFTRPSAAELGNAMEVNLGTVPANQPPTNTTTPPVTMQSDTTSAQTTAPNNNWTASSPGTGNSTVTPENLLGNSNQMTTVSASNEIPITHTLDGQSTSSVPNASSLTETSAHFRTQVIAEQGTSQSVYQ